MPVLNESTKQYKNMKKKTMTSLLILIVISAVVVCAIGIMIKSAEFERVEIKVGETVLVKGNPVKLISIEEENKK